MILRCTVVLLTLSWSKGKHNKCEAEFEDSKYHLILQSLFYLLLSVQIFILSQRNFSYLSKGTLYYVYDPFLLDTKNIIFIDDCSMVKAMATHPSTPAWTIPRTEKPGGLQSMGSLRVRHNWATSLSLFTFTHWRRKWQPTPVFLPGESQGQVSLVGCRLWGRTESDTTETTSQQQQQRRHFCFTEKNLKCNDREGLKRACMGQNHHCPVRSSMSLRTMMLKF